MSDKLTMGRVSFGPAVVGSGSYLAIDWKAEAARIQKLWDDDHELLVDRVASWKENAEEMQARALKAEAERDAAYRAVNAAYGRWMDHPHSTDWAIEHAPVIEAARKMGGE